MSGKLTKVKAPLPEGEGFGVRAGQILSSHQTLAYNSSVTTSPPESARCNWSP